MSSIRLMKSWRRPSPIVYLRKPTVRARSLVVDEGSLRKHKTFYDVMTPMERADYVYTTICELRSPEATPRASPAKKRDEKQQ
jgi:hypothetical protein